MQRKRTSHLEALKSSTVIGGSTAIVMIIRMIRTKVIAVLLGPSGVGLEAIFDSIVSLARTVVDLGMHTSGVRQIAVAAATGSQEPIARTATVLRRACLIFGLIGALAVFLGRDSISQLAFGSTERAREIAILSLILVFGAAAGGHGALLTGMRRITDLARMEIWGTLLGAAASIPIVLVMGLEGVAVYMVVAAGAGVLVSWYYVRQVRLPVVTLTSRDVCREAAALLRLGFAFVTTSVMSVGALFLLRVLVTRTAGVEAAGQFQAASALSSVYVGFVLTAMGRDFFPRLSAVASDNARCNQTVNEQAEVSFLLALPGLLATLALAPWVIRGFYSAEFSIAHEILAWQLVGMLLRLASWPLGFILMAKGRSFTFMATDALAWTVYVLFGWLGLRYFGLVGLGIAFLLLYAFYFALIYVVVRAITGFRFSPGNVRLLWLGIVGTGAALWVRLSLIEPWSTIVGSLLAVTIGLYCARQIVGFVGLERITHFVRSFLHMAR